jgi:hypothetical protein
MRSSFRYIAILIIWLATIVAVFDMNVAESIKMMMLDLSGACMSFVIGERMYLSLKK